MTLRHCSIGPLACALWRTWAAASPERRAGHPGARVLCWGPGAGGRQPVSSTPARLSPGTTQWTRAPAAPTLRSSPWRCNKMELSIPAPEAGPEPSPTSGRHGGHAAPAPRGGDQFPGTRTSSAGLTSPHSGSADPTVPGPLVCLGPVTPTSTAEPQGGQRGLPGRPPTRRPRPFIYQD